MPITRQHEQTIAAAVADDHGNVQLDTHTRLLTITPDEAVALADEIWAAAVTANQYRAELTGVA